MASRPATELDELEERHGVKIRGVMIQRRIVFFVGDESGELLFDGWTFEADKLTKRLRRLEGNYEP